MSRQSSLTVTYKDLIAWVKKQEGYAKQRLASAPGRGIMNVESIVHDIACANQIRRMLEKCEPGHQNNLFEIFETLKK